MNIRLPEYNGKDNLVLAMVVLPVTLAINTLYLGGFYYSSPMIFLMTTLTALIISAINFIICGYIAVSVRNRLPDEQDLVKRLTIMIIIFFLVSGSFLYLLFGIYEILPFVAVPFNEQNFAWAYFAHGIVNIFITFIMEGISRYKEWKLNMEETERLYSNYKQSQLNGLKSQVNPHFLFNSLNTLSSLIQENEEDAEAFLNEMSKVYRYMLQNDQEQLVPLETELNFLSSYIHLLKARYGDGLGIKINVNERDRDMLIPPLALQVIIENAFTQNVVSKAKPLQIEIASEGNVAVVVRYNLQPKSFSENMEFETGLDNLVKKFEMLGGHVCVDEKDSKFRTIGIPLIIRKGGKIL